MVNGLFNKVHVMTDEEQHKKIIDLIKHLGVSVEEFMVKSFLRDSIQTMDEIHVIQNGIMNFASNMMWKIQQSLDKDFREIFVIHCIKIFTHRFVEELNNKPKLND